MGKIAVRYLVSGYVEIDEPDGFNNMDDVKKRQVVEKIINNFDDSTILEGMSNVGGTTISIDIDNQFGHGSMFDECLSVEAIEDVATEENILCTNLWHEYAYCDDELM